jgi:hypothetical protein
MRALLVFAERDENNGTLLSGYIQTLRGRASIYWYAARRPLMAFTRIKSANTEG